MTDYEFGDVVLVPFPFTDQTTTKKRPAVVVSSQTYHRTRSDLILMAITSQTRPSKGVPEVRVGEWERAGLLKPSVVKPVLATIEKALVLRKLGRLEASDQSALQEILRKILG